MPKRSDAGEATHGRGGRPVALQATVAMGVFLGVLWAIQIFDSATHYRLLSLGIEPRTFAKAEDILTAPFIHVSYTHLIDNSLPLAVLGFFVALRGIWRFVAITGVIIVISGVGVWLTAPTGSDTVGASGVIFGYFGFLVALGIIDRRIVDLGIGLVVGVLYWSILPDLLPGHPGISWQGHLFGLIGGLSAAWLFSERRQAQLSPPPVNDRSLEPPKLS